MRIEGILFEQSPIPNLLDRGVYDGSDQWEKRLIIKKQGYIQFVATKNPRKI